MKFRKKHVSLTGLLLMTCLISIGFARQGESDFDWQRFAGESIRVFIPDNGQVQYFSSKIADFEALTGITVEIETADSTNYRSTLPVRLTTRASDFDVMATFPEVDGRQFDANGWYVDLTPYVEDARLTNPEFDYADFPAGVRRSFHVGEQLVAIPWEMQTALVYYRRDVLEDAGLKVPNTFEEWLAAAAQVHDPKSDFYGLALRGIPYQTTTPFSAFLHAYCGEWVTGDRQAAIASPEALDAWRMFGQWGEYGPPGMVGFDWHVPSQQFAQGRVFAFLDINLFVPTLEDPEQSRVAGNIGYAPVPEGPCGRAPFVGGWGYGINPFSSKKDAAWYFIQWVTGVEINEEMKVAGHPSPRSSAWSSEAFRANDATPEFTKVVLESLEIASAVMNPPVAPGVEAREIVGQVGNAALRGISEEELRQLANQQNAELQRLIDAE